MAAQRHQGALPRRRKAILIVASAAALATCHPRRAPSDGAANAADAGADSADSAGVDGAGVDSGTNDDVDASNDAGLRTFSADAWLHGHGVAVWGHDASCWWKSSVPPGADTWTNLCDCNEALVLATPAPVELMVCRRTLETREPNISYLRRSVVYAATGGVLRVVLDVPSAAALDGEAFGLYAVPGAPFPPQPPVGNVNLAVAAEGADLIVSDEGATARGGAPCLEALAAADRLGERAVRRVYAKVCASVGRWRWVGGQLVRQQPRIVK